MTANVVNNVTNPNTAMNKRRSPKRIYRRCRDLEVESFEDLLRWKDGRDPNHEENSWITVFYGGHSHE